jgi:hypothetical protein
MIPRYITAVDPVYSCTSPPRPIDSIDLNFGQQEPLGASVMSASREVQANSRPCCHRRQTRGNAAMERNVFAYWRLGVSRLRRCKPSATDLMFAGACAANGVVISVVQAVRRFMKQLPLSLDSPGRKQQRPGPRSKRAALCPPHPTPVIHMTWIDLNPLGTD